MLTTDTIVPRQQHTCATLHGKSLHAQFLPLQAFEDLIRSTRLSVDHLVCNEMSNEVSRANFEFHYSPPVVESRFRTDDRLHTLVERDRMSLCLKGMIRSKFAPWDDMVFDWYLKLAPICSAFPLIPLL